MQKDFVNFSKCSSKVPVILHTEYERGYEDVAGQIISQNKNEIQKMGYQNHCFFTLQGVGFHNEHKKG